MTTTDKAFIKAYRPDAARTATPRPAHLRQGGSAAWRASVEIVSPVGASSESAVARAQPTGPNDANVGHVAGLPAEHANVERSVGRRPLSAFLAERVVSPPHTDAAFIPETTISAFRWPRICRALWEQYCDRYDRVAELLLARCRDQRSLVGVAGLRPGDGCTTTLLCLAMGLAAREARAVLVDANFAAPRLAHRLGVEPTATWQDVLVRGLPVAEAVIHAVNDGVDLLPLGSQVYDGEQLGGGLQAAVTAGVLRQAYQITLLDLGAILDTDAFATTSQLIRNMRIDAAVLVTDAHRTDSGELVTAGELLREHECELLGAIENRVAKTQAISLG
jgi:Mrp family chromosome partitioning ATPase